MNSAWEWKLCRQTESYSWILVETDGQDELVWLTLWTNTIRMRINKSHQRKDEGLNFITRTWLRDVRVIAIANSSVVCNVHVPYSGVGTFGNISSPFCTLAILWPPCKILRRLSQGNPSIWGVKRKRGIATVYTYVPFGYFIFWWVSWLYLLRKFLLFSVLYKMEQVV